MQDSYGDGWNDGYLEVFLNGTLIRKFSGTGLGSIETFEVCNNDNLRLKYTSGQYEEENTYQIFNDAWDVIFSDGPYPKTGNVFSKSTNCNNPAQAGKHPCIALDLETGVSKMGQNEGAETSGINPNCGAYQEGDIWYATTIPPSGNMAFDIKQQGENNVGYAIWQGADCGLLQKIACGQTSVDTIVTLIDIPAGQKVYTQVWGANGENVTYDLKWTDSGRINLENSELPVIYIQTNGQDIPYDGRLDARMNIRYKGEEIYDGPIGIKIRGASSAGYPQQPYSIETRDSTGANKDVSILRMPEENDWILLSNFNDRSLARNTLPHYFFTQMGNYSPATRHCEVMIDSAYKGIYVLTEKIKRDKNRVDISKLNPDDIEGDELTGGYILQQNLRGDGDSFQSNYSPIDHPGLDVHFLYEYPDALTITPPQKTYIAAFIDSLETQLYSDDFRDPTHGYRKYLDVLSFIDYFIVNEVARNADGFKKSIFYHKDRNSKDNKLKAGPVWDFDWAWKNLGICYLYDNFEGAGWAHLNNDCPTDNNSSGWYIRMLQDSTFANELQCTYRMYRQSILDTTYIFQYLDSIQHLVSKPQLRHFERWRILGFSGPAPEIGGIATNYEAELDTLKSWIATRLQWLDNNMPGNCTISSQSEIDVFNTTGIQCFPNPSTGKIQFKGRLRQSQESMLNIYESTGKLIDQMPIKQEQFILNYNTQSSGLYFYTITTKSAVQHSGKFLIVDSN
ncbi:MAG: CotH kinase family protein [Saprospiraceae bacterium]|nr:CotH kinase family protein [Saprospiraceae bacterium]